MEKDHATETTARRERGTDDALEPEPRHAAPARTIEEHRFFRPTVAPARPRPGRDVRTSPRGG
ncbi:MAG TPA: hypothetical protein VI318_23320 [Baekduia sp.]